MKKIKIFFKKKYSLCLMVLLIFCMGISLTYKNKKVVLGASTVLEQDYYYVLPQVQLGSQSSASAVFPTSLFSTTINTSNPDEQVPILYTLTGNNPSNSWRYVKRTFIKTSLSNLFDVSFAPYVIFPGNGSTISSAQFGPSATHSARYHNNTLSSFVIYSYGRVTVSELTSATSIKYELCTDSSFSSLDSDSYVSINIIYDVVNSNSNYNYVVTFNPTYISSSATSSIGYNEGYTVGYTEGQNIGYNNGYIVGYNNGVSDSNVFTFTNLISAVIDVPINSFKSLLNFNFLDINLLDFALSIITLFVVIKIVGVINGKT